MIGRLVTALEGAAELIAAEAASRHANHDPVGELRVLKVLNRTRDAIKEAKP